MNVKTITIFSKKGLRHIKETKQWDLFADGVTCWNFFFLRNYIPKQPTLTTKFETTYSAILFGNQYKNFLLACTKQNKNLDTCSFDRWTFQHWMQQHIFYINPYPANVENTVIS
jgi:hypothetical protein